MNAIFVPVMAIIAIPIFLIPVSISGLQGFTLVIPYADAGSKESQSESEDLSDSTETENQPTDTESDDIEAEDSSNTYTNESAGVTTSEDITNTTASTSGPESITMSPSDLIPENQTSIQTQGEPNATLNIQEKLSKGIIPNVTITAPPPTYKVKVTFDTMPVHEDHEGVGSGDGEYDIIAYVQGIKVGLTDASYNRDLCAGWWCNTGGALLDVSEGETVYFKDATVTVYITLDTVPLLILTVGEELDNCFRLSHPDDISEEIYKFLAFPLGYDAWFEEINEIQNYDNPNIFLFHDVSWWCVQNQNDAIGSVVIFRKFPEMKTTPGRFVEVADNLDFTLTGHVTASLEPPLASNQGTFNTSNLSSTKNFEGELNNNFATKRNNNFSSGSFSPSK